MRRVTEEFLLRVSFVVEKRRWILLILMIVIGEEAFFNNIRQVKDKMREQQVSISIGLLWRNKTKDLEKMLKDADALMYEEKEKYHKAS